MVVGDGENVLVNGREISLFLRFGAETPDRVAATLISGGGTRTPLVLHPPRRGWGGLPGDSCSLEIPSGAVNGPYELEVRAWKGRTIFFEEIRDVRVVGGGWFITGLDIFPPQGAPGGHFYSRVLLSIPEDSDAQIRWKIDGQTIASGLWSQGWDEVVLPASLSEQMQTLTVELHPSGSEDKSVPYRTLNADLYTAPSPKPGRDDLIDDGLYPLLVHFDGRLFNEIEEATPPLIQGKPRPVQSGGLLGFRFSPGDSVEWEWSLGQEGFGLHLALHRLAPEGGDLFRIETPEGEVLYSLVAGESFVLTAHGSESWMMALPRPESDSYALGITWKPDDDEGLLRWTVDGDTVSVARGQFPALPTDQPLVAVLGGTDGFTGVVTELGIHQSGELDLFSFFHSMGQGFLLAEGFEDLSVDSKLRLTSQTQILDGGLFMSPGSALEWPALGDTTILLQLSDTNEYPEIRLREAESGALIALIPFEEVLVRERAGFFTLLLEKTALMGDNDTEAVYELKSSVSTVADGADDGSNQRDSLGAPTASDLRLEHILVTRESL